MIDFHNLTETLAKHLIAKPEFLDFIRTLGIDPAEWPESKARHLAQTYIKLRESENHEYAVHMLARDAQFLKINYDVPLEPGALEVIYKRLHRVFRVKRLADNLALAEESEYDSLIEQYLSAQTRGIKVYDFAEEVASLLKANEEAVKSGQAKVLIPGWKRLSEAIGGFNPGRVSLLVADTGFGKTNLSVNLARAASEVGPVLFVNMEMLAGDLGDKIVMGSTGVSFDSYKSLNFPAEKMNALKGLKINRLLYTGGKSLSMQEIYALARQRKSKHGLFMLFVDYDQKIKLNTSRETPEWKALQIAIEQLEELAKNLEIYILCMAQSDSDGNPSGSKRSKYAASTVLRFHKADGKTVIQAIKNRFGKHNVAISVKYEAEKSLVEEDGWADLETMAAPKASARYIGD